MAGLTVAAVALPLALAFGVSSGADAASGLITAIVAGIFIGLLSGASLSDFGTDRRDVGNIDYLIGKIRHTRCADCRDCFPVFCC